MVAKFGQGDQLEGATSVTGMASSRYSQGCQAFNGETTGALMFLGDSLQHGNHLLVLAFSDKELWRFFQSDHGDAQDRQDEDKCARSVPDIAPALVVVVGAAGRIGAGVVGHKGPREQACNQLSNA